MFKEVRDGTGKLSTPDSHVDNEYDTKTMIYNRKKNKKEEGKKNEKRGRRLKKIQQ